MSFFARSFLFLVDVEAWGFRSHRLDKGVADVSGGSRITSGCVDPSAGLELRVINNVGARDCRLFLFKKYQDHLYLSGSRV